MDTVGKRVKHAREAAGMTQKELAARTGFSQPGIARLERNGAKSTKMIVQIAEATGFAPYWLATGKGNERPIIRQEHTKEFSELPEEMQKLALTLIRAIIKPK